MTRAVTGAELRRLLQTYDVLARELPQQGHYERVRLALLELVELRSLVAELIGAAVLVDSRLRWVEAQIDRVSYERARELVKQWDAP